MGKLQDVLIKLRSDKGWSYRDAANKTGISHNYLSNLEKGTDPRPDSKYSSL